MREILFRGKRQYTGEWAESVCPLGVMHAGHLCDDFEPSTVGQYTGLTDKNGKKIFEGDILENVWKVDNIVVSREIYVVTFFGGAFGTEQYAHGKRQNNSIPFADNEFGTNERHCEVIGNIHDNPELLKTV